MSARARLLGFLVGAAGLGALLLGGRRGLPDFGAARSPYGELVNALVVPERHLTNAVTAVTFAGVR